MPVTKKGKKAPVKGTSYSKHMLLEEPWLKKNWWWITSLGTILLVLFGGIYRFSKIEQEFREHIRQHSKEIERLRTEQKELRNSVESNFTSLKIDIGKHQTQLEILQKK